MANLLNFSPTNFSLFMVFIPSISELHCITYMCITVLAFLYNVNIEQVDTLPFKNQALQDIMNRDSDSW